MKKPRPSTIYVNGETVAQTRKIEEATGIKASRLFQEFVGRYAQSLEGGHAHSVNSLAFLLPGMVNWEVYAPRPFFEQQADALSGTDIWPDAFRDGLSPAFRVVLVGKTLANPVLNHEKMWNDYLSRGGTLQVLLQGDLSGGVDEWPRLSATTTQASRYEKAQVRSRTVECLRRLADTTETDKLEVRNTGQALLTTNASLIFREDDTLDIYISFNFAEMSGSRSVVILTTATHSPPDETCELVAKPYERLWLASTSEPGFEHLNSQINSFVPSSTR